MGEVMHWDAIVYGLPDWLSDYASPGDERPTRLAVRKTIGRLVRKLADPKTPSYQHFEVVPSGNIDEVVTPDGEEVIFVEPDSQWYRNVLYSDIENLAAFRGWRDGPKYDAEHGLNPRHGKPVYMVPLSCLDKDPSEYPEQPWGKAWKARVAEIKRELDGQNVGASQRTISLEDE